MSTAILPALLPSGTCVLDMPREKWLRARDAGVGASETPDILGVGYGSPLEVYCRKLGLAPEVEESEAMRIGNLMEPVIAELYSRRTGVELSARQVFVHRDDFPRGFATLDGMRVDGRPVEFKSVGVNAAREWGPEEHGLHGVPPRHLAQMTHQLLASGAQSIDIAALLGTELRVFTLRHSEAVGEGATGHVRSRVAWFLDHLDRRVPPPADGPGDDARIVLLHPEAEGVIRLDDEAGSDAVRFLELGGRIREMEKERAAARARVLERMGGAALAELPDGRRLARRVTKREARTVTMKASIYATLTEKKGTGYADGQDD